MTVGTGRPALCLYGHFYQPPRADPFTGQIRDELPAAPYANFNEKITAECYRPNAEAGNFAAISFDLGPTLAAWLEHAHPAVYAQIIAADQEHFTRYGVGNALAQVYNHTILPLANERDRRVQINWGLADFSRRFGHRAQGMWLAESAVDLETLALLAEYGIEYTVLAPWQAAEPIDSSEPYRVRLPNGRGITVCFFNGPLSDGVSFDWDITSNADLFAASHLRQQLAPEKLGRGDPQMLLVATDGELYGHHKPWRDKFLSRLVRHGAADAGCEVSSLGRYLRDHPPTREVALRVPSSWSCHHGLARWATGCACTEGDSSWKSLIRAALTHLQERVDTIFERDTATVLAQPWAAREAYLALREGWIGAEEYWGRWSTNEHGPAAPEVERARLMLEAEYWTQSMFTSCGFFFEDLDRIEPRNNIACARRAISLVWQASREDLQTAFLTDLAQAQSERSRFSGADVYRWLPPVHEGLLPPPPDDTARAEPAA